MVDYLIIGGGVIGSFIAYELAPVGSVSLFEKESDLSQVQTTHNSALVHSPVLITPDKGELKAKFAIEGNRFYQEHAEDLGVPILKNGAFLVAKTDEEMAHAKEYLENAKARGIHDAHILSAAAMMIAEPNLKDDIKGGLNLPTAMTADTYQLSKTLERHAKAHGAMFYMNEAVTDIEVTEGGFIVHTTKGKYAAKHIINAAGVFAETIALMVEKDVPYKTRPHRGEYYVLSPQAKGWVHKTLFPMPNKITKGILVIPQPDGTIRLGPTSTHQKSLTDDTPTNAGLSAVKAGIEDLVKHIPMDAVIDTYVGIRATTDYHDFYIKRSLEHPDFIHVAGIDSPGVTAAPAIARYVREDLLKLKAA